MNQTLFQCASSVASHTSGFCYFISNRMQTIFVFRQDDFLALFMQSNFDDILMVIEEYFVLFVDL